MPAIRFSFEEVTKVVPCPAGKARMVIQEICGVSDLDNAYLGELDVVLIAFYQWADRMGYKENVFRICKQIRECDGFSGALTAVRQACEAGDPGSTTALVSVVIYEHRYVTWYGGDGFLDLVTSEYLPKLPGPPEYFTAWSATTALVRIIGSLKQGAQQDAKQTEEAKLPDG